RNRFWTRKRSRRPISTRASPGGNRTTRATRANPDARTAMPEFIIRDDNFNQFVDPPTINAQKVGPALAPRDFALVPHGSSATAPAFDLPIVPRAEWSARIKAMEDAQSRLSDVVRALGMPSLYQGQTNYCWANAPVNCVRVLRAAAGLPF